MKIKNKILVITRNYPPKIGGLEIFSFNLIHSFQEDSDTATFKITLSKSNLHLLWFFPVALIKSCLLLKNNNIKYVHLCDGVLAPLGFLLKWFFNTQVSVTLHGLDVTYKNPVYQLIVPKCIASLDKVVCVSHSTRHEAIKRGVPVRKCHVVLNGVNPEDFKVRMTRDEISNLVVRISGLCIGSKKVLLTVGRLVKRKGVVWFLNHVFPLLSDDQVYLIVGSGPEEIDIKKVIGKKGYEGRVKLLAGLSCSDRNILYHGVDLFIMPNIVVSGDVEGFGITAIEASICGLPVIASNLQGITDAVIDGVTGRLVAPGDVENFVRAIEILGLDRVKVHSETVKFYAWEKCYQKYKQYVFDEVN